MAVIAAGPGMVMMGPMEPSGGPGILGGNPVLMPGAASSSSWGLSRSEISTLAGCEIGWCCNAIICADGASDREIEDRRKIERRWAKVKDGRSCLE
jgi:hypothetical protein